MIPEKSISAATASFIASLRAMELGWVDTDMPDGVTIDVRDFDLAAAISEALEAAAPYMLAEAWEDAADAIEAKRIVPELDQYYVTWLKTQAETIREGATNDPGRSGDTMSNPERRPLPEGVHDSFTYLCADCGCTVTVVQSITQPHACKGTVEREIAADAWDKGRRAGQMDPRGLYPTPNPYRSQG